MGSIFRITKEVLLLLLVLGESLGLEAGLESGQTVAKSAALAPPPLAAEPLSLRLGGEDVHLVLRAVFVLTSEFAGSEVKFGSSGSLLVKFALSGEASRSCGLWLC